MYVWFDNRPPGLGSVMPKCTWKMVEWQHLRDCDWICLNTHTHVYLYICIVLLSRFQNIFSSRVYPQTLGSQVRLIRHHPVGSKGNQIINKNKPTKFWPACAVPSIKQIVEPYMGIWCHKSQSRGIYRTGSVLRISGGAVDMLMFYIDVNTKHKIQNLG